MTHETPDEFLQLVLLLTGVNFELCKLKLRACCSL